MIVNLKANDLEGYSKEVFEFVETRRKQEVMQLGMHLCMKGRQQKKAQAKELVGENLGLLYNMKTQWVLFTNNWVQVFFWGQESSDKVSTGFITGVNTDVLYIVYESQL